MPAGLQLDETSEAVLRELQQIGAAAVIEGEGGARLAALAHALRLDEHEEEAAGRARHAGAGGGGGLGLQHLCAIPSRLMAVLLRSRL